MAFIVSPGVLVTEQDLFGGITPEATAIGGYVGDFAWGPVLEVTTIASESDLVSNFGRPSSSLAASWYTASNFLAYSSNLKLVRAANTGVSGAKNSVSSGTAILIKNQADWEANFADGQAAVGPFAAKYPGTIGDTFSVSAVDSGSWLVTLSGTAVASLNSKTVTGTGTTFTTQTSIGSTIYSGSSIVGVVKSVDSDTQLTLEANALVAVAGTAIKSLWKYASLFDSAPSTSSYSSLQGGSNDELHIVVVDALGWWSGTPGTVLEKWAFVSKASDAKTEQGASNFYRDVLKASKYVWWMDHISSGWNLELAATAFTTIAAPYEATLTGGADSSPADSDLMAGYDLLSDAETVDVSLLFTGPASTVVSAYVVQIADTRKDAVAFVSPLMASVVNNPGSELTDVIADRNATGSNTSYGFMDSGWKQQYDRYNDAYVWVPLNGDTAGLTARIEQSHDAWWSPAANGSIKNVVKLAWNPNKASRDELYKNCVNPVVQLPGEGTLLYGDKTMLSRQGAFSFIGVRRLFIVLEKSIAKAARGMLFQFNDAFSRAQFRNMVEPFLRDVKGRRGLLSFAVVCNESNNTDQQLATGEFVADLYITPNVSIQGVRLNFVAVRSTVTFTEIVGG